MIFEPRRVPALLLGLATLLGACNQGSSPQPGTAARYELRGEVVAVDPEAGTVTVAHDAVPDFMSAMTMPFNVRDRWVFEAAEPGALIQAELVVEGTSSWLERVVITRPPTAGAAAEAVVAQPKVGQPVPSTPLVDQDGQPFDLAATGDRPLAFTFIYTRCPLPDFCPRMSEHFLEVYRTVRADPARYGDPLLVSITVDPAYDTPAVLREYGLRYLGEEGAGGFAGWRFARAEPEALGELALFTGLRFMPERGELVHSLRTVVVDAHGRVGRLLVGNSWRPAELLQVLEELAAGDDHGS